MPHKRPNKNHLEIVGRAIEVLFKTRNEAQIKPGFARVRDGGKFA